MSDTGFNPYHNIVHVESYPTGVQRYKCTVCGYEFIFDWEFTRGTMLNNGDPDAHADTTLLDDWVSGIDLNGLIE